jgi:hypothetical protein
MIAAEDPQEQARFAQETYRELRLSRSVVPPFLAGPDREPPAPGTTDKSDSEDVESEESK